MPRRERGNLRSLMFQNRKNLRKLEKKGVSRSQLRGAVVSLCEADEFPRGDDPGYLAQLILAELLDDPSVDLPQGSFLDGILELIERLMPLIETWISGCGI